MEETLPTIEIHGTTFEVDVAKRELRQLGEEDNLIPFHEMEDLGTHYEFMYHPESKNISNTSWDGIEVKIPPMLELDPTGMAAAYGKELEELKGKTDFDIINDPAALAERLKGRQPLLEIIPGHEFYVHMHWGKLDPTDLHFEHILLSEIDYCYEDDGDCYMMVYDPETRKPIELYPDEIVAIPKDYIIVEIPGEQRLDPVGYAKKYGWDQKEILRATALQMSMKGIVHSWDVVGIAELIESNIKRQSQERPHVIINDKLYLIEQESKVLISALNHDLQIDLKAMDMNPEGTEYLCFFNTAENKVVHPYGQNNHSKDLHILTIPVDLASNSQTKGLDAKLLPVNKPKVADRQKRKMVSNKITKGRSR